MPPAPAAPDNHGFVKRLECPPSGALLAYAGKSFAGRMREEIEAHLAHCDFCGAGRRRGCLSRAPRPPRAADRRARLTRERPPRRGL